MKTVSILLGMLLFGVTAQAQFTKASLQASGLTCSMCSKAVLSALQGVPFIEKVQVDIKNQRYNISFKKDSEVEFDELSKAVTDAGFSVAALTITATMDGISVSKDKHITLGDKTLHFLSTKEKTLNGEATFQLVDKGFLSAKEAKKWSAASKMKCVQTGKMESCCTGNGASTRVYHAII